MSPDTELIEEILLAATLPDAQISARVADIGPDVVAEAMLAEVACRAALLDALNHQEQIRNGNDGPSMTELTVTAVHLHHNLALIEKGLNTEQTAPGWISRS